MMEDSKLTFDEVIEEHRLLVGAEKIHLTLGPDATPENIREILRQDRELMVDYNSFTKEEQQFALTARLKRYLSNCFRAVQKLDLKDPNQLAVRNEVMRLTDIIPDVVAHEDIPWMLDHRKKKHQGPPTLSTKYESPKTRCPECGSFDCDPDGIGHYRG